MDWRTTIGAALLRPAIAIGEGLRLAARRWIFTVYQRPETRRGTYMFKTNASGVFGCNKGNAPARRSDCDWPPRLKHLALGTGHVGKWLRDWRKGARSITRSEYGFLALLNGF